jgi:hypothetical protein
MLNLFVAAGRQHYAKSVHLYLQEMGDHRLATDLIVEPTVMRSAKLRGGLTHGRGMSESVRVLWVKNLHSCATVHAGMMNVTNLDNAKGDVGDVMLAMLKMDNSAVTEVKVRKAAQAKTLADLCCKVSGEGNTLPADSSVVQPIACNCTAKSKHGNILRTRIDSHANIDI